MFTWLQNKINKIDTPVWLEWLFGIVFVLRIPTFFEPFYYGDEMIYLTLGHGIRNGLVLYSQIHDNKPPLLYLIAAIAGNVFWFKVILCFWSLGTLYLFWKLVNNLFPANAKLQKVATVGFALLTTLPLLEGNIANAENFFIGLIIAAFWLLLTKPHTVKNLFISGLLFSLATLFKIPASFDIPAIFLYWLIVGGINKENIFISVKKITIVMIGWIIPLGLTFIWYFFRGALPDYAIAAFMQNFGYLSSFRPEDVQEPFLVRNLPLLIRAGLVGLAAVVLYFRRKTFSKEFIFTVLWLFLTLFAATLSERPYPHYLLQSAAPIAILIAIFVASKNMHQIYALVPLFVAAFIPVYFKFYHYNTITYYSRFVRFASGNLTKQDYFNNFDSKVERNYKIAEFLKNSSTKDDQVFVWGDSAPIYALSRRLPNFKYIANYHIYDFSTPDEVLTRLSQKPPKFIIITPEMANFPDLNIFVEQRYVLVEKIGDAEIWSRM